MQERDVREGEMQERCKREIRKREQERQYKDVRDERKCKKMNKRKTQERGAR